MKSITHGRSARDKVLHIEADGVLVNIHVGLTDNAGHHVTHVSISPDDESRGGDAEGYYWYRDDARIIRLESGEQPPAPERGLNGVNVPDHGGRSVNENAARATEDVIERAVRRPDGTRGPNPDWDARAEVYDRRVGRVEQYMIAGNGPTEWLCFVFRTGGELDHAYLRYVSSGDPAVIHIGQYDGEALYQQVKRYHR